MKNSGGNSTVCTHLDYNTDEIKNPKTEKRNFSLLKRESGKY